MAAQGLAFFNGVQSLLGFSFTFGQGITPSVANLTIPPQPGRLLQNGELLLTYGPTRIRFPRCRVDVAEATVDPEGREVWALRILDRRWIWREAGKISGFYNVRRGAPRDGILGGTVKRPQELAKLCLEAMGEKGFDVSALPDDSFPEISWDYENPAEALANLAGLLGCRVVLGLDDRTRIVEVGKGETLKLTPTALEGALSEDPGDPPGKIVIVGGRTEFQGDFALEPVGLERDGKVVPIGSLSYAPKVAGRKTWEYTDVDHFQDVSNLRDRGLAQQSVFRWYRIKTPFRLPGLKQKFRDLDRILPLLTRQAEIFETADGRKEPRPPWIYGRFWDGGETVKPAETKLERDLENKPRGLYTKGFSLDANLGVVKFSEPVYLCKLDPTLTSGQRVNPAQIVLRVAVNLRDDETRAWIRAEYERKPPGKKADKKSAAYIVADEITAQFWTQWSAPAGVKDNTKQTKKEAADRLEVEVARYDTRTAGAFTYGGFVKISPDGAIAQITWTIDSRGFATTRVSRNREELISTPSFAERRMFERIDRALAEREKPERQKRADAERGRG